MPVHKLLHRRTPSPVMPASSSSRTPSSSAAPAAAAAAPTAAAAAASPASKYPRFGKRGAPQAFPSKLYEILEGENPDIVGWTATGRGFEVRDHARLSSEVLGRFFKQDKFSSFQRQLNLYGFRKITKGSESGSYQHPHFRRGERTTLLTIRRSTKASPARVAVLVSPASAGTGTGTPPPAAHLNGSGGGNNNNVSTTNGAAVDDKHPRSATPSPPPAPVSRGALPWPRPPALVGGAGGGGGPFQQGQGQQQQPSTSGAREVTPDGTTPHNNTVPAKRQRQEGNDSWGPYPDTAAAAPATTAGGHNAAAREEWQQWPGASNPSSSSSSDAIAANATAEQEAVKAQAQSALDQNDVEVVSLLQRMAKEAQDSPARKRVALAAQQWEGARAQQAAAGESSPARHAQQQQQQQQQQQARFEKPRPAPVGSDEAGQTQQMVFAERLYDILNHERLGAGGGAAASQQARFLSLAFGTEGRAAPPGFPQKQYQQHYQGAGLPSPFGSTATTASCSSSPSSSSASSAAFSHLPLPPQLQEQPRRRQDPSESVESTHRRGGEGEEGTAATGGMVMSEQERQALLARSRSGPSAVASAEQDRQALLARPRTGPGPAGYSRDDEHRYYQQQQDAGYMYDRSPDRSPLGRGGGFSFGSGRFGSGAPQGSGGGALPPLPSLNFEQYNVGGGGGGGGGPVGVGEIRRAPWYGPESSYAPPPIGSYVN
ncbi:unnamed protein product [Ectocarpus sp. 8 AP-2014]